MNCGRAFCSFDVVRDGLGGPRSAFPHTVTLAAGTQAATPKQNAVALMKLSNLVQGKHGSKVTALPKCSPSKYIHAESPPSSLRSSHSLYTSLLQWAE